MKILSSKKIIVLGIIIIIVIGGYFFYSKNKEESPYEFIVAQKSNLTQEISVTGRVKAVQSVNLSFEQGGKINQVYVNVGDRILKGKYLASLNNLQLKAQLLQAEANLQSKQAELVGLKKGARKEELKVQEIKVQNAQKNLDDIKKDVVNKIKDAYTKADDAVRNKTDQLFSNSRSDNPLLILNTGQQLKTDLEWGRFLMEKTLRDWNLSVNNLNSKSNLKQSITKTKENLNQIRLFLNNMALMVNGLNAEASLSQATINIYRTDVTTARTNIDIATTNILTTESSLQTKESNLILAKQELILKQAGATKEQILSQEAVVKGAEANLKNIQAQLDKTIIRAPFSGVITKKNIEKGEVVAPGILVLSMISEGKFEIEANVPEADVAKIQIGDLAKVTLDAYNDDVLFEAEVTQIDPAETIIEGVATYKTTLIFTKEDKKILPGMTANIDILTENLQNVITIPSRSVVSQNGFKIARLLNGDNSIKETRVKTGVYDSQGNVEIIEGIKEGDRVIVFFK